MTEILNYKSKEYYKSIRSIKVEPLKVRDLSKYLVRKKGDVITKKRFFRTPKITIITEDLYKCHEGALCDAKSFANSYFFNTLYNEEGGFFYSPAMVTVNFEKRNDVYKFDTNEEMENFVRDLKSKCEKCDNELL